MGVICMWDILDENIKKWGIFKSVDISRVFKGKKIMITGATGLIGQALVNTFIEMNKIWNLEMKVYCVVRNLHKAEKLWGAESEKIIYIKKDFIKDDLNSEEKVDYILHTVSVTDSYSFVNRPVETILTGLEGINNVLNFAYKNKVSSIVFLSSMEVYGKGFGVNEIDENMIGALNPLEERNSYPIMKIMSENLCRSYYKEYGVDVKIARLSQTFGPGVEYNDGRVFMEFARCAIEKRNIILNTDGKSERMYLYTYDAVEALLYILLKGEAGQAYNVGNKNTYCSIYEMANLVKNQIADNQIDIIVNKKENIKYMKEHHFKLNIEQIEKLGWKPRYDMYDMYKRMIDSFM